MVRLRSAYPGWLGPTRVLAEEVVVADRYGEVEERNWAEARERLGDDVNTATAARMYDYYLGGVHNFAADRQAAAKVIDSMPLVPDIARANRDFLGRAVRYLVGQGVRQFLDIGSGMPTQGNVHQAAQEVAPDASVVYVDIDPVAVMHSRGLLEGNARAAAVLGDLRRPGELLEILDSPEVRAVVDLDKPVALLLVALLHFVPDDDEAYGSVAQLRERLVPGSWMVVSHGAAEGFIAAQAKAVQGVYQQRTATPGGLRTAEEVLRFFGDDFEVVEPGLVWTPQWRPDPDRQGGPFADQPERSGMHAAVAHYPAA
ncbi:SAM-dependent methyltransferase [Actinomycetes bacterium KLBMP 9797]